MRRLLLTNYFILISVLLFAQDTYKQTKNIVVQGKVKESKTITIEDFKKFKSNPIGDVTISNHKGEAKGVAKALHGVQLKDVLETIVLDTESPKLFSEYYFACIATDGYKVVFSWNEIFNTTTGNSIFIITEKEGKTMADINEGILMISTQDFKTGRRYVKNLEKIVVGKIE